MPRRRAPDPTPTRLSVKDHIIDRTIYLIGERGTTDVTVREIAAAAGVNVAAVSYYFSSKEQMFAQMAERFTAGFEAVMALLEAPGQPPEARLRAWASEVMRLLVDYPGILGLMERHVTATPRDAFGEALRTAVHRALTALEDALSEYVGARDPSRVAFKLNLLVSALAGPFPTRVTPGPGGEGRSSPRTRSRFLDLLLEHLRA
jgi:AcrR family transcriptional regulator